MTDYKFSKYNSILKTDAKLNVLYNGLSDRFIVFRKKLRALLDKDIEELKNTSEEFYRTLVEADAIIATDRDEFAELKSLSEKIDNAQHECKIIVNPTMDCNFKCWYCYENHVVNSKINSDILERIKRLIRRQTENEQIEFIDLAFFGGEPLLQYPAIKELIDYTREQCCYQKKNYHLGFTSNGYLLNEEIINHLSSIEDSKSFQITLDGDREKHNKIRHEKNNSDSYDTIIFNSKILLKHKIHVLLRINYTLHNILSVKNILADINDIPETDRKYLRISFHRVWQDIDHDEGNKTLIADIIESFKSEFDQTNDSYHMNDMRYPCYVDKQGTVVVNYNGDVYKCTARNFSAENRYGILLSDGTIAWDQQKLEKRKHAKMNKEICKSCRILPLCGGGCAQNSVENPDNFCGLAFTESDKDRIIFNHFYNRYLNNTYNE